MEEVEGRRKEEKSRKKMRGKGENKKEFSYHNASH